jgi:curli biogenesis system outer membrane secretion channel CsgG
MSVLMALFMLLQAAGTPAQNPAGKATPAKSAAPTAVATVSVEQETAQKLLQVRRIYVDSFGEDALSRQIQNMIVSSLGESKKFLVTENKDKADAILKGSGLEKTSQELHSYDDATAAGSAGGYANATHAAVGGAAAAIRDSATSTETINDARVAVRLVDRDGDVIWSTTQESKGAKYKGATADVADKVVKQLLRDLEKATKKTDSTAAQ